MNNCVVVIPIYKENPNKSEQASFKQAISILKNHPITIITYKELNLATYKEIASSNNKLYNTEYFDKVYFASLNGYNHLCLHKEFYKRFLNYKFMLIYQLDAWVFKDELDYWCNKGYDYIGAPWFYNWGRYEKGNELWEVGNGGFCLRKVSFFYQLLSYRWPLSYKIIKNKGFYEFIKSVLKLLGIHNTISWYVSQEKSYIPEDYFLVCYLKNITNIRKLHAYKPSTEEAAHFSFERSPAYLFYLCKNKLPFGCHAYKKNDFDSFWSKYIKEELYQR